MHGAAPEPVSLSVQRKRGGHDQVGATCHYATIGERDVERMRGRLAVKLHVLVILEWATKRETERHEHEAQRKRS